MTAEKLVGVLIPDGYRSIGGQKIQFAPEDVYLAASFAQNEILSELLLLEKTVQLALASGQERYQFTPASITGLTVASPIVLTFASHDFHTGDTVIVSGAEGCAEANGEWTATRISATQISLDTSVGVNSWTGGGIVNHGINAAIKVKDEGIRKLSSSGATLYGALVKKTQAELEEYREEFAAISSPEILYFAEEYADPLAITVMATPSADTLTKVTFFRRPLEHEDISEEQDPIIPTRFDALLVVGTWYHMLSLRTEAFVQQERDRALKQFEFEKLRWLRIHGRARRVPEELYRGIRLG